MTFLAIPTCCLFAFGLGYAEVPWYGNALLALWLWCFGGNVGSFMNVVIYRIPIGRSVVYPGSRCPACRKAIRWYDNIPVISWLILRARCRNCGIHISARYPLVEALVAAVFLVIAFLSPIAMGENLPERPMEPPFRYQTMLSLWLMYAFHMMLYCTLICAALIRYDGKTTPFRIFAPMLATGITAPLFWPTLHPVPFHSPIRLSEPLPAMIDSVAGLFIGIALGLFVSVTSGPRDRRLLRAWEVMAPGMVGLAFGWQAACALVCFATLGHVVNSMLSRTGLPLVRVPWTAHLTVGALLYVIFWGSIVRQAPWLGSHATIATFGGAALLACALAFIAGRIAPPIPTGIRSPFEQERDPGVTAMNEDANSDAILNSPSFRLAELDTDFLQRDELRPVRLQLELLKPEMALTEQGVESTIVAFGGTQIVEHDEAVRRLDVAREALAKSPDDPQLQRKVDRADKVAAKSRYYDAARDFGRLVSATCQSNDHFDFVIITGGGPGVMEAANRGAFDVNAKSIGLNIVLPAEQVPNPYITPTLCFQFHYFALRKMHLLMRAKALVVFPGGFGTLDELFDALTLRQTNRMQEIPIILFGREYWERVIDFQFLADEGVIADEHLDLFQYAETPEQAWEIISSFYGLH